jgi:Ca2+ transporting ATPase
VTKFLQFQLTANVVALVTAAGGALALRSSPLSAVQMLWVNLIMDSLASLALATEAPTDDSLDEPPRVRDGPIITPTVAKSILGQAALQLGIMVALLGPLGNALVAAGGDTAAVGLNPDDHSCQYTLVFNSFVMMQLFNQVNSRKIHDEPDVLEGLGHQKLFLVILGLEMALQVIIVQAGGRAFSTVPLNTVQWAACLGFGGLTLLLRQLLRIFPTEPPSAGPGSWAAGTTAATRR